MWKNLLESFVLSIPEKYHGPQSIYDPSELKLRKPWIKENNVCFDWNRMKCNIFLKIKVEALQKVKERAENL